MDKYRDVMIKVIVEDMEHCSTECTYLEGDEMYGLCAVFGSVHRDKESGNFCRHSECCISER